MRTPKQWLQNGIFEDDETVVESGHNAIYLRTGGAEGTPCMLTPEGGRELAAKILRAVEESEKSCTP